jgi:Outer membrane protein beta-barrel domain
MRVQLKRSFAGSVAWVALMSAAHSADLQPVLKAPAAVEQQATGFVEIYSGWASTKSDALFCAGGECIFPSSFRDHGWALGGAGRGNYWISRDVSVQVDVQAEGTSYDAQGGHFSSHSYLVGGHWSWRNPQQYLFGLFAAAGEAGGAGLFDSQRHGLIGAEAQWYWSQFTFYVQGGYDSTLGNVDSGTDNVSAWFIRGTGRYFINPNFLIEGGVMYDNGSIDHTSGLSSDFRTWSWNVKGEWRLPTAPFSVYARYQGSETKYDSSEFYGLSTAKITDHRVLLGLKLHMGDRTLQQADRAGATLDIVSPLANPTSPLMFSPFLGGL